MLRWLFAVLLVVAAPSVAAAQTDVMRMPQGTQMVERPGHPDELLMGSSFGPLISDDGGGTWHWICEDAVGYGGNYDPDYAYSPTGAIFATTFNGLRVSRDHCQFDATALGPGFATTIAQGSDGTLHVAMSFPGDNTVDPPLPEDRKIYRSTNDGMSFDAGITVGTGGEIWSTIEVAPSDAQRVYLTGFRIETGGTRSHFLLRSTNGGDSYTPLAITDFTVTDQSELFIMGISPTDPQRVLLRVSRYRPNSEPGDEYFLSTNGGTSWTSVMQFLDSARSSIFLANGEVLIGSRSLGIYRSTTGGATFTQVTGTVPTIFCLHERPGGEVWACTDPLSDPPLDELIMNTTTLAQWTGVLRMQDIDGPAACPSGTIQRDCCVDDLAPPACPDLHSLWCRVRVALGIVEDPTGCLAPDAAMGGDMTEPPKKGCCDAGAAPGGTGILVIFVALGLARRRTL
jgi:hypothetical protein